MNEIQRMQIEVDALKRRVRALEQSVRPITTLQGIDGNMIADQAVVAFLAETYHSTLAQVAGPERGQQITATRRAVARALAERAGWSKYRIARSLNRSEAGIRKLLG